MVARGPRERVEAWLARADAHPRPWLIAGAALLAVQISPLWYAAPDGAAYLSIARSIAAGGPPARFGLSELSYPLGYPLLISPAFLSGPRPFLLLSIINWLLAVLFMLGTYRWMRRHVGSGALWLTVLVMANTSVWMLYRRTLSEVAFLAVMIWTVNALNAALDTLPRAPGGTAPRRDLVGLVVAAGLLIALTAVREAGVLFGAGFAVALLARAAAGATSRRVTAIALAVSAAALAIALVSVRSERIAAAGPVLAGNMDGYGDADSAVVGGAGERVRLRVSEIGQLLVPGMFRAYDRGWIGINSALYAALFAAIALGWLRLVRRGADVLACSAPLYLLAHLFWPYSAGTRYMLPLLPLLVACLWMLIESQRSWRLQIVAVSLLAHVGVALGYWLAVDLPEARACARQWPAVEEVASRIGPASGAAAATDLPPCVLLMLALQLDRPVARTAGLSDTRAEWLVTAASIAPVGYRYEAAAGDLHLLRRAD